MYEGRWYRAPMSGLRLCLQGLPTPLGEVLNVVNDKYVRAFSIRGCCVRFLRLWDNYDPNTEFMGHA